MARCSITKPSKLRRIATQVGEPIVGALVRGGTDHRIDALLPGGRVICIFRDGEIREDDIGWTASPGKEPTTVFAPTTPSP